MKRSWMNLISGVCATFVAVGCQSSPKCADCCAARPTAPTASVVSATPPPTRRLALEPMPPQQAAPRTMPNASVANTPVQTGPNSQPMQPAPRNLPSEAVAQAPVNFEQSAPPVQPAPQSPAVSMPVATPTPPSNQGASSKTGSEGGYNSPDYSILFGVLDYNSRRGIWKLRYADAGQDDRYGGCVTLENMGRQMSEFKSGQTVRIEGTLVDPESREAGPAYRVRDIRPVE